MCNAEMHWTRRLCVYLGPPLLLRPCRVKCDTWGSHVEREGLEWLLCLRHVSIVGLALATKGTRQRKILKTS